MFKRFPMGACALLGSVSLCLNNPALGASHFPREASYHALYSQALSQGYGDLARGVAVFRDYRGAIESCSAEGSESTRAFGGFLDSVVHTFQGYLNGANLRNRSVRAGIADYVTQCAALIELYAERKAERYNAGSGRLDAADERLVATARELHSRMGALLMVGLPSVQGAKQSWKAADLRVWERDGRFGFAAKAITALDPSKDPYCKAL
jgi:hypothetical protein